MGASPEGKATNVALVLLSDAKLPRGEDVQKAFLSYGLEGQYLRFLGKKTTRERGEALEFTLDRGGSALVMLMPAPVPNHEADAAARFSVSAFGGRWKLPRHRAHLVVTATEEAAPLAAVSSFTSFVAAVVQGSSAVGVYFGSAGATHDPKFFQEVARQRDDAARLALWNGVSIAKEPGMRLNLLSLGMRSLALPDLLLSVPTSMTDGALDLLFELLKETTRNGKPSPRGEFVPSPVDPKVKVLRVQVD
jgi:hypothetical protein